MQLTLRLFDGHEVVDLLPGQQCCGLGRGVSGIDGHPLDKACAPVGRKQRAQRQLDGRPLVGVTFDGPLVDDQRRLRRDERGAVDADQPAKLAVGRLLELNVGKQGAQGAAKLFGTKVGREKSRFWLASDPGVPRDKPRGGANREKDLWPNRRANLRGGVEAWRRQDPESMETRSEHMEQPWGHRKMRSLIYVATASAIPCAPPPWSQCRSMCSFVASWTRVPPSLRASVTP